MAKGRTRRHERESSMESISYLLTEDEGPEKETSMASENTGRTLGESIEKNKTNLVRSENPEQQALLATSGYLCKQPEGNKERFSHE